MAKESFLDSVLQQSAIYIELKDSNSEADPDNPRLLESSQLAFSQLRSFLCRPIQKKTYVEEHKSVQGRFDVIVPPIDSITSIIANYDDTNPLVLDTDYRIIGNSIEFIPSDTNFTIGKDTFFGLSFDHGYKEKDPDRIFFDNIRITYVGGDSKAKDEILNALVMQTSANFKRAPFTGISQIAGGGPTGSVSFSNSPGSGLMKDVQQMVAHLKYFGPSRILSETDAP